MKKHVFLSLPLLSLPFPSPGALVLALTLVLGQVAISTAAAEPLRDAALSPSGEIYLAKSGLCRDLLPTCPGGTADHTVLVVDLVRPGQAGEPILVPGTEGTEIEGSPALIFEDASNSLVVVWESKLEPSLSRLNLSWLADGVWSEIIEVSGNIAPLKGTPQVAITRDAFELTQASETSGEAAPEQALSERHVRTILHVTWWEEGAEAEAVYYTPIILEDGAYVGNNPVFNLVERAPPAEGGTPAGASLPASSNQSPRIEPGPDESSVVVGFIHPTSGRFLSFDIHVLPSELGVLADSLYEELSTTSPTGNAAEVAGLADRARGHMIEVGRRLYLHPVFLDFLAGEIAELITTSPHGGPPQDLADRARGHMIEVGARLFGRGGRSTDLASEVGEILETGSPSKAFGKSHALWLRLVADRPAPEAGDGPTWIFLSEDGRKALVSWEEKGALLYRESTPEAWTEVHRIELEGLIDAARAEQILRQRVRQH